MRIPFDSFTLAAVVAELRNFIGSKVQKVSQPEEDAVLLGLYGTQGESALLISWSPIFFRMHLATKRPPNPSTPPQFCMALRAKLEQARLRAVEQVRFDRISVLSFEGREGDYRLIAELMGKHSNLFLVDSGDRLVGVGKPIGPSKSVRPMLMGRTYTPPPVQPRASILDAAEGVPLRDLEGASPFLVKLIDAGLPGGLDAVRHAASTCRFSPVLSPGNGAYPLSVAALGLPEIERQGMSIAIEQHYSTAESDYRVEQVRAGLLGQLRRVLLSREAALSDLAQAREASARAPAWQLQGELVLTYGPSLPEGSAVLDTVDYSGEPISIRLDPTLGYLENANRLFDKAKKAKAGAGIVEDQIRRLSQEREELESAVARAESAQSLGDIEALQEQSRARRWLFAQRAARGGKEQKPFEGHRIRELVGPGGYPVLFGETADANDYLTLRVAKPDDLWLHVRGSASAHVVIRTSRHPERVGPELLMFAAQIAVQNSPSKHSGLVPVDYTLKKFVRKPHGAKAGMTLYTHEKTVHVGRTG